ncbi:unnamed protein product, partial [Didymodactylos carnosus]
MDRLNEKMTNLQEQVEGISISTDKGVRALSAQFEDSMRELRHLISRPTYTEELLTSQQDAPTTMSPPIHISSTIASVSTSHLQHTVLIQPPTPPPTFSGLTSEKPLHFLVKLQQYTVAMYGWNTDTLLRNILNYLLRKPNKQWNQCLQKTEEPINEFIVRLRALWYEQKPEENESRLIRRIFQSSTIVEDARNHRFNFEEPSILAYDSNERKREIKETLLTQKFAVWALSEILFK